MCVLGLGAQMAGACGRGLAWHCLSLADRSCRVARPPAQAGGQQALLAPWTAGLGPHMGLGQGRFRVLSATSFLGDTPGLCLALRFPGLFVRVDGSAYRPGFAQALST